MARNGIAMEMILELRWSVPHPSGARLEVFQETKFLHIKADIIN